MTHTSDATFLARAVFVTWTFIWFIQHIWYIDRFKALKWRRVKKFELKSAITILLLLMCPLQASYDISASIIKYREGFIVNPLNGDIVSKPQQFWSDTDKSLAIPIDYILCLSFSVQTCLLFLLQSFWNYLASNIAKTTFMGSFEFKSYIIFSIFSIFTFPTLRYIFRDNDLLTEVVPELTYSIFMILIGLLGVRSHWRFTRLLISTNKSSAVQMNIISKLFYFRDMNRYLTFALFIGSISFAALSIDGLTAAKWLNTHKFTSDLLVCHLNFSIWIVFITLILIFYPSSSTIDGSIQSSSSSSSTTKASSSASTNASSSNKLLSKNEKSSNPPRWFPKSSTSPMVSEDRVRLNNSSVPWSSQQSRSVNNEINDTYHIHIKDDDSFVINVHTNPLDIISPPLTTPPSPYRPYATNEPPTTPKTSKSSSSSPSSPPSSPLLPPPVAIPMTASTNQFNFYNSASTIKTNKNIEILKYPSSPLTKSTFDISNHDRKSSNGGGVIQIPQKASTLQLSSSSQSYGNDNNNNNNNSHFLQKFSDSTTSKSSSTNSTLPATNVSSSSSSATKAPPSPLPKKSPKRPMNIITTKTETHTKNDVNNNNNDDDDDDDDSDSDNSPNTIITTKNPIINDLKLSNQKKPLKSDPKSHHKLIINTSIINGGGFNKNKNSSSSSLSSNTGNTNIVSKDQKTKASSSKQTIVTANTITRHPSVESFAEGPLTTSPSPLPTNKKSSNKSSSTSSNSKSKKSTSSQQTVSNSNRPYQQSPLNPKRSSKLESSSSSPNLRTIPIVPITVRARSGSSSAVMESNNMRKSVMIRDRSNSTATNGNSNNNNRNRNRNSIVIGDGNTNSRSGSANSIRSNASTSSSGGGGGGSNSVRGIRNILGRDRSNSNSSNASSISESSSNSSSSSSSGGNGGNNKAKIRKGILKNKIIKPTRDTVLSVV